MKQIWKFRLFALLMVIVGGFAFSNLAAQFLRPPPPPLPSRSQAALSQDQISSAANVSAIAPFRSDLKADHAIALAGQALKSQPAAQAETNAAAQGAIKSALKLSPHDSRLWLVLAMLEAQKNPADQQISESLKMSYLTGPNRTELIPIRLDAVTLHESLYDTDLKELARGDVRIVLTHMPERRQELIGDYSRASSIGKTFLEESARTFDPKFADLLRNAR
jgi:hypothetical protein